jgi:hypothetical protein
MKKIEISNKLFNLIVYVFLIYGIIANLLMLKVDISSIIKLVIGVIVFVLFLIKHEKFKLFIQIISVLSIVSVILQVISIIIKIGINEKPTYGIIDYILMLIIFIISVYLFVGSKKYINKV